MEKKITKKEMFGLIAKEVAHNEEMVAFLEKQIELLDKKKGSADSKKVEEQKAIFEVIRNVLASNEKPLTVTQMMKANAELSELSNQKVSAMLKKMVDNGEVVKTVEKKVSYFSIA